MQRQIRIEGSFRQFSRNLFGFTLAAYDLKQALTIDPVIESRQYIGDDP